LVALVFTAVRKALFYPARQIAFKTGDGPDGKVLDKETYSPGCHAQTGEYGNLMTNGIIALATVVRCVTCGPSCRRA
jgi:hypothetical protein